MTGCYGDLIADVSFLFLQFSQPETEPWAILQFLFPQRLRVMGIVGKHTLLLHLKGEPISLVCKICSTFYLQTNILHTTCKVLRFLHIYSNCNPSCAWPLLITVNRRKSGTSRLSWSSSAILLLCKFVTKFSSWFRTCENVKEVMRCESLPQLDGEFCGIFERMATHCMQNYFYDKPTLKKKFGSPRTTDAAEVTCQSMNRIKPRGNKTPPRPENVHKQPN